MAHTTEPPAFACLRCGVCCNGRPGWVLLTEADYQRWAAAGREDLIESRVPGHFGQDGLPVRPDGQCVHQGEDGLCQIHGIRPDTCRDFQAGCDQCVAARRLADQRQVRRRVTAFLEQQIAARARRSRPAR